jgi:hypothetical protein
MRPHIALLRESTPPSGFFDQKQISADKQGVFLKDFGGAARI